jgi:hypothetical protein
MKKIAILLFICLTAFTNVKARTPDLNEAFNNIIKAYLELKNALVTDNSTKAKTGATNLLTALSEVRDKDFDEATRKVWLANTAKLRFDARHISESDDINHQREHFATLSTNMLGVLKTPIINTITLYKQYCPMKKKYWVSETAMIKNPYYGSKMITCGETKGTIKAHLLK